MLVRPYNPEFLPGIASRDEYKIYRVVNGAFTIVRRGGAFFGIRKKLWIVKFENLWRSLTQLELKRRKLVALRQDYLLCSPRYLRRCMFKQSLKHPFHLVVPSPWPFFVMCSLASVTVGGVLVFHNYVGGSFMLLWGVFSLSVVCWNWFRDIIRESTFEGHHTRSVQQGLRLGMVLFIVSEIMFFVSFFWGFFHSSLAPAIQIGGIWPPEGVSVFNPWEVPLLNTVILLTSGVSVTWTHFAVRSVVTHVLDRNSMVSSALRRECRQFCYRQCVLWRPSLFFFLLRCKGYAEDEEVRDKIQEAASFSYNYWKFFAFCQKMSRRFRVRADRGMRYCLRIIQWSFTDNEFVQATMWYAVCYYSELDRWRSSLSLGIRYFFFAEMYRFFSTSRGDMLFSLCVTCGLGCFFTIVQYYEYQHALFTISDSVYGATFFVTTGFHGLHVLIGTLFLFVCLIRCFKYHFTAAHHVGLECAVWYWHFVDVVWLGLYLSIYHWGGL